VKAISEIKFGFSDAENYRRRENKDIFNKIFLRTEALDRLCERNVFFLVGEKGTGKTAYAVYLSNSPYRNNRSIHKFIRETDYHKFVSLRRENRLGLSDYSDIWKVIVYLLLSDFISRSAGTKQFLLKYRKFNALRDAVDEYYQNAFDPEIPTALQFVENSSRAAELVAKHIPVTAAFRAEQKTETRSEKRKFQTNLLVLEKHFRESLSSLSLEQSHVLFIDGIDIRPEAIPYDEYLDCVKGLATAVWSVNNDFFPTIRDSTGRLRVILLVRPDIFNSLGLQNRNTKLKDNSVVLDWKTTYEAHRSSNIFKLADRLFAAQQDHVVPSGACWDYYFPFDASTVNYPQSESRRYHTSFIVLLRYSFHRPRDILTILDILQSLYLSNGSAHSVFRYEDLFTPDFRRAYGDYALGEVKDSLSFYYDSSEFDSFPKFFEYLEGRHRFSYEQYILAYDRLLAFLQAQRKTAPEFMQSPEQFLQFLYELNIICYMEDVGDERFFRWCFIERTPSNASPKVKTEMEYEIHYALANTLNTGKPIRRRLKRGEAPPTHPLLDYAKPKAAAAPDSGPPASTARSRLKTSTGEEGGRNTAQRRETNSPAEVQSGMIKWFNSKTGYGFIIQEGLPPDIFFSKSSLPRNMRVRVKQLVNFELDKDTSGRTVATNIRPLRRSKS
jgi:cold shock CspA family protein